MQSPNRICIPFNITTSPIASERNHHLKHSMPLFVAKSREVVLPECGFYCFPRGGFPRSDNAPFIRTCTDRGLLFLPKPAKACAREPGMETTSPQQNRRAV